VAAREARLEGNGLVLAERRNKAGGPIPARPFGAHLTTHVGVAALEKDQSFPSDCALP